MNFCKIILCWIKKDDFIFYRFHLVTLAEYSETIFYFLIKRIVYGQIKLEKGEKVEIKEKNRQTKFKYLNG